MFPNHTSSGEVRVAITGMGILTSMGHGCAENAAGFRAGRVALRNITLFDPIRQRVTQAGQVELPRELPVTLLGKSALRRVDRSLALVLHAAVEAWHQAGLSLGAWSGRRVPLCLGTSAGAMQIGEEFYKQCINTPADHRGQATRVEQYQIRQQAQLVADALGLDGGVLIISNACASGANSIGHAFHEIRAGRSVAAVCGGYDALAEMVFAGFDSLQALSTTLPRPFDANRDGLAIGEGAGMLVIESFEHAQARGAAILGEICGYGAATDLHHLTQPHPQGDAALAAMQAACCEAGISPADVGYINSHGTGTVLNDEAEAQAICRWAEDPALAANIAVSSTKGAIGHLLGGAGSVESVICLLAMQGGWLPPTPNIRTLDAACQFDVVQAPRDQSVDYTLTNSFGFGGANATLIFGRPDRKIDPQECQPKPLSLAKNQRIAVTGCGACSPAGWGVDALRAAVDNRLEISFQQTQRVSGAVTVRTRAVPLPASPLTFLKEPRLRRISAIGRYLTAAALEAMAARGPRPAGHRLGIVLTVLNGCVNYSRRFYAEVLTDPKTASPILFPETVFNAPASHLSALFQSTCINYTLVAGRDGFLDGLNVAKHWLQDGRVDGVLVACAEELDWLSSEAVTLSAKDSIVTEGAAAIYLEPSDTRLDLDTRLAQITPQRKAEVKKVLGDGLGVEAGWFLVLSS